MFKKFAVSLVVAALFVGVSFSTVSAQGMTLAQLVDLFISLGIISPDKAQAAKNAISNSGSTGTVSSTASAGSSCGTLLTRDLTLGSTGADVKVLQNQLGLYPGSSYFGTATQDAVKNFQASNGVAATGSVGPETRAKFNSVYGCQSQSAAPVAVVNSVSNTGVSTTRPTITLIGSPTITKTTLSTGASGVPGVKIVATFNLQITATGADYIFFKESSFGLGPYRDGRESYEVGTQSTTITLPASGVVTAGYPSGQFNLPQNNSVQIPVTYTFTNKNSQGVAIPGGQYAVGLDLIAYQKTSGESGRILYAGMPEWRTSTVTVEGSSTGPVSSIYHAADANRDWKIDMYELEKFQTLYNYKSGTVRTGDYHCIYGSFEGGSGDRSCTPHSADTNKDWKLSLLELTRVIELKNASSYKIQVGTEDGFAPIVVAISPMTVSITSHFNNQTVSMDDYINESYLAKENFRASVSGGSGNYKASWVFDDVNTYYQEAGSNENNFSTGDTRNTAYIFNTPGSWKVSLSVVDDKGNNAVAQPVMLTLAKTITTTASCTDSDGGVNLDVAGLADGRVNGLGSYFNDSSVGTNGGVCSGTGCTGVAEGYCSNNQVKNMVYQCPSGYSVNGVCTPKPNTPSTNAFPAITNVSTDKSSYKVGDQYTITWTLSSAPDASENPHIGIGLFNESGSRVFNVVNTCDYVSNCVNIDAKTGTYSYTGTIPSEVGAISNTVSTGAYKFEVSLISKKAFVTNGLTSNLVYIPLNPTTPTTPPATSGYHSADTNKDWKISDSEAARVQTLYSYKNGTTRTGEYHCASGTVDGYDVAAGDTSCGNHSADSNKDWKLSLLELTRIIEFKNSSGYKTETGTEDGFAPVAFSGYPNLGSAFVSLEDIMKLVNALR